MYNVAKASASQGKEEFVLPPPHDEIEFIK